MKIQKSMATDCVVRDNGSELIRERGADNPRIDPEACKVVESVRRLMALGLTVSEIEQLDIHRPTLRAICEYARLDEREGDRPAEVVESTLRMVNEEMQQLDLELEMLGLRKRALRKRAKLLKNVGNMLESGDNDLPSL